MAGIVVDRVYERRLASLVNSREQGLIARGRRGLEREQSDDQEAHKCFSMIARIARARRVHIEWRLRCPAD